MVDSYHNTKTMKAINHIHYSFPSIFLATISVSIEEEQQKQTENERLRKECIGCFSPFVVWKVKFWYLVAGKISQTEHFTDMTET